ncbi:hypothetical protein F7725_006873 [Dissostichus mawsoni]|uniref:Solute carrier family 13 member 2 n=1 Tax=Dissostichus mawsoni TaxID=36200 RepID=A0A7J5XVS7_DISMA|nr:hypothetical protein F7725_006873 [Dissostichus mawsoni]
MGSSRRTIHICLRWMWYHRNYIIIVVLPLALLPLPLVIHTQEAKCGYAIILMALYWCTECMPLAVTALLPVVLFPMMGIMKAADVSIEYLKDSNMLFIGGLLVAIAVEQWSLHTRIALRVLLLVGVRPALLMMGFMIVSSFLSMWISNSATTAMMLPIASAVLQQLKATEAQADERDFQAAAQDNQVFELEISQSKQEMSEEKHPDTKAQLDNGQCENGLSAESLQDSKRRVMDEKYALLTKGMSLSVCYAASIGGTATLTGTTPNIILKGQIDKLFPGNGDVINFASWFGFAFPNALIMLVLAYFWLLFMFLGFNLKKSFGCGVNNDRDKEAYKVMRQEYKKLGSMRFAEWAVLIIFVLLVVLWFSREPGFIEGWATVLFNKGGPFVSDGTVAIFMSMLFFIIPSQRPRCGGYGTDENGNTLNPLMTKIPNNDVPVTQSSSHWCNFLLVATFTECSSNTATTTLFLPILASMAVAIKIHPLYVMLPCTIAASLAFMLPVATPPNAIAFAFGKLKVIDMVKAGFMLNIIGILSVNLGVNTWGYAMFDMGNIPHWVNITNSKP